MNFKSTILLLIAVVATGLYIQFGERHQETTDQRRAEARLALKFDPDKIDMLRIELPDSLYVIGKTNRSWRLMSPVSAYADATAVMRIIDTIGELRKSEIITASEVRDLGIQPSAYGFSSPRAVLTLRNGPRETSLLIGKDSPGAHQLYMKQQNRDDIIVTDRDILDVLPESVLDIRDRHLFSGQPGSIERIELQSVNGTWQSSRNKQDQWIIEKPIYARGLSSSIRQWLDGIYAFRVDDFIADSVAAGSLYGFDEPAAQVSLFSDQKSVPQVLKVGRPADVKETTHYATIVGQEAVFTVTDDFVTWLKPDTAEFRDSRLLAVPLMNISFIQMKNGERVLQLAKNTGDVWEVTSPKRFVAHDVRIQRLLSTWSGARADNFIDPPLKKADQDVMQKATHSIRFSRTIPNGTSPAQTSVTNIADVTQENDVTFRLAERKQAGRLYISPEDQSYIMDVSTNLLAYFSVNPLDYRDAVVLSFDTYDIRRITQKSGDDDVSVFRTNGLFEARSPQDEPDHEAIDEILSLVSRLIAVRLVEEDSTDITPYGLDKPAGTLVLGLSGEAGINRVILIGSSTEDGETFAMIQGTDLVFTLSNETAEALMSPVANSLVSPPRPSTDNAE